MARDRQRSKQRQAERRAARLAQESQGGAAAPADDDERDERTRADRTDGAARAPESPSSEPSAIPGVVPPVGFDPGGDPRTAEQADPLLRPREGQMGELTAEEEVLEEERVKEDLAEAPDEIDPETIPRTPSDDELGGQVTSRERGESGRHRPRLVNFLIAVWAELRRVQWPDRPTLITLTWVVVVFVVIMGGYLGLLDALFARLIDAIL